MSNIQEQLVSVIVIFAIVVVINKVAQNIIKKIIKKSPQKNITTILIFLRKVISFCIYSIGMILILNQFSLFKAFSITLLSSIGLVFTVLGLAVKESLNNFFGSLEIIFSKPFEVGDFISLPEKNVRGTVEEVSMRHTVIKTSNNYREIIPNYLLNSLIIENMDYIDNEICLFENYSISYDSDVDKAVEIIKEEILNNCEIKFSKKNKDVEFPKVRVIKLDSSCVSIKAWIWGQNSGEAYDNLYNLNQAIKRRFDEEKIEIPYNYVNVINKK